jgi:hypothetical protein
MSRPFIRQPGAQPQSGLIILSFVSIILSISIITSSSRLFRATPDLRCASLSNVVRQCWCVTPTDVVFWLHVSILSGCYLSFVSSRGASLWRLFVVNFIIRIPIQDDWHGTVSPSFLHLVYVLENYPKVNPHPITFVVIMFPIAIFYIWCKTNVIAGTLRRACGKGKKSSEHWCFEPSLFPDVVVLCYRTIKDHSSL